MVNFASSKAFSKRVVFIPQGYHTLKKKCIQLFVGRTVFKKTFCGTKKLSFGATFNSPQCKK